MNQSGKSLRWMLGVPIALALATSGCATKSYVRKQVTPVNQRVNNLENNVAGLAQKQGRDISRVNERITSAELRVSQVSELANQAQGTASRAVTAAEANRAGIATASASVDKLAVDVANSLNFQVVETGDVTFYFGRDTLTPEAKAALDAIFAKYQAMPRGVIELTGFTDQVGGARYNLELSRRRAQSVQRYLVQKGVPVRNIYVAGLGKEPPPPDLVAETGMSCCRGADRLARRVHIRLLGAGDITRGSAARSQQ